MINLQFQFKRFISVVPKHTYYAENPGRELKFIPTEATSRLINKIGMLLRQDEKGLHILCDGERKEALQMKLEQSNLKFTFWLYSNNPYFINVTDLSTESAGKVLYLKNPADAKKNSIKLHKEDYVGVKDIYAIRNNSFDFPTEENKPSKVTLKNEKGEVILDKQVDPGYSLTSFKGLAEGGYQLFLNDKEKEKFIAIAERINKPPLAFVEITFSKAMKDEVLAKLTRDEDIPQYEFDINFKARQTYWQYLVVSKYHKNIEEASVYSESKDVKFKGPKETALVDGTKAFSFESNVSLPLKEYSDFHFQLRKKNGNSANKVLVRRLPVPPIDSIKPESRDENSKVFSEIIIYV